MPAILDTESALDRLDGDVELLRELAESFRENAEAMLARVRDACARGDAAALRQAAHALKGSAANLSGLAVVDVAQELEQLGTSGDASRSGPLLAALETEMRRLDEALAALL